MRLTPVADQTRGATQLRRGKGGDSHARPRAEGGPYQRGRGERKGERGGGREAGERRGQDAAGHV